MTLLDLITIAIVVFVLFNGVLTAVLAVIWAERKALARLQQRVGPSRTGPSGILQTAADAIKLMLKEDVRPAEVNRLIFYAAPLLIFTPIFMLWMVLPFGPDWVLSDLDIGPVLRRGHSWAIRRGSCAGGLGIQQQIRAAR